ncbi:hypothetical protein C0989_002933 [Termitomyces sp. Mn162]|nr:hypothetical protein C0989_002933 [Termitomyces sp. Mn162]
MHPRSFFVVFLTLALSSCIAQAAPASSHDQSECSSAQVQTVYQTVTVTASSMTSTSSSSSNNNQKSGNNQNSSSNDQSNSSSSNHNSNSETSVDDTLDPRVIAKGFANNGQDVPTAGQVSSLTSTNNFINFCLTVPNLPITNGKQITTGSCNPAPIGGIPSTDNMPSAKFSSPKNFATIKANTSFTIEMNIRGMETGFFVNADENYFAAPQQLNAQGQIKGHSHVVIEQLDSLEQATPTDPQKFAFFKGLNSAAVNGKLTADVTVGLPAGVYRLASINTNANHAPAIVPVAQHGSLDDAIYFTVTEDGIPVVGAASSATSSIAASSTLASFASVRASASAFGSISASVAVSASKTTSVTNTVSATKVTSFVTASTTTKASTDKVSTEKASSTNKASSTTEVPSTPTSKDASSAAFPTASETSSKAARDLRFRRRWNFRK